MYELHEHRQARWVLENLIVMGDIQNRNYSPKQCIDIIADALKNYDKSRTGKNSYADGFER